MTSKELFNRLTEYPQPTRIEVLTELETLTRDYNQEYTVALLADFEELLNDWKYTNFVARLEAEYNEKVLAPYNEALHHAEYAIAMGCNKPIEWPEEPPRFTPPPPFPGCYDDSVIFVAPMYEYAVEVLRSKMVIDNSIVATSPDWLSLLSDELRTERAIKYFTRAIERGYMTPTSTGLRWVFGGDRGGKARLGYFIVKVFCPTNTENVHEKAINNLFGITRIGSAITQVFNAKKPQRWRWEIDSIFED